MCNFFKKLWINKNSWGALLNLNYIGLAAGPVESI